MPKITLIWPLYPFIYSFPFHPCVLMIIDYWGCGLYIPLVTFLFSIMHYYLHVEVFFQHVFKLSYHLSINICLFGYIRGCGWKMLQCHMEATQLANIFSWALYHTHLTSISKLRVWFLLVYLPPWTASISKLSAEWPNVLSTGCAACISTISLYMPVQNIRNKSLYLLLQQEQTF